MSYETILFDVSGAVARLTLNRPDRLNSFNVEMHEEVAEALGEVARSGARVLLLTGAGRGFCAGQDLSDRSVAPAAEPPAVRQGAPRPGSGGVDLGESLEKRYNPLVRTLTSLPLPVVAAVNGVAAGAGANIALACDIVIAAKSAKFIQSFANIGLLPDSGGTFALPRLVGQARALGLALTGEALSAEKAESWGLIWKCVEDGALATEADALVARFAAAPTRGLGAIKGAIRSSSARTLSDALDYERDMQRALGRSADYREGVAAFLEKRKPNFMGQ